MITGFLECQECGKTTPYGRSTGEGRGVQYVCGRERPEEAATFDFRWYRGWVETDAGGFCPAHIKTLPDIDFTPDPAFVEELDERFAAEIAQEMKARGEV